MKDRYIFPAVLTYAEDGVSVDFPDLPGCLPCGHMTEEALANAKEAMALHIWSMEKDQDEIPEPSHIDQIKLEAHQIPILVEVFMPLYRDAIESQSVKKTLTIPQWLERLANERKINYSHVLQAGLMYSLGLSKSLRIGPAPKRLSVRFSKKRGQAGPERSKYNKVR